MKIYVPAKGVREPAIAIVAEAPSYEEENALEPLVGPSGRFLNSVLHSVGINRNECWVTNVCKYMVPPNPRKGKKIEFWKRAASVGIKREETEMELRYELAQINPTLILCLGNTALNTVTGKNGIGDYRGSILQGMDGKKTIATYHPSHILHQDGEVKGYWNRYIMEFDIARAAEQSKFKEIILPQRSLHVAKSSHQFVNFLERYSSFTLPAVDIEAHPNGSCIPICVGIAFTPHEGITIPLWNRDNVSNLPDSEITNLWILLDRFFAENKIIGQNFGYDEDKLRMLGFKCQLAEDTLLTAFATQPELPKNLAFNTSIHTLEPFYKNEGMYDGSVEDLLIGCARDSCCTKEVWLSHMEDMKELGTREYYEQFLIPLRHCYAQMERRGFAVDNTARRNLITKYIRWQTKLDYDLYKLAGHAVNVNSWQQVGRLLYEEWKIPERSGTSEEVLTSILNSNVVKNESYREGIGLILEGRRVRKTISTYLFAAADYDGRMRTSYFLCLDTGRSSTSQQEAPIRPTIHYRDPFDGKKKKQAYGMAFQTLTKHGDIGQDIRSMLVPDEGCVFLQADSSQAEARVIFLLANEDLRLFDDHDLHALTASWFFGGTEFDYSKKVLGYESPLRFAGKTLRHAGHLGAGKRRAATSVNTDARKFKILDPKTSKTFQITEAKAGVALDIFHKRQPNIQKVYHAEVIRCLEKDRRLSAPVPVGVNSKIGGTRIFYERFGDELNRMAFSYIPQRAVSENTKCAALYITSYSGGEIPILAESHDALVVQVKKQYAQEAAKVLKYALERPIDFSTCSIPRGELVIPCEVEIGYNYQELEKFKFLVEEGVA